MLQKEPQDRVWQFYRILLILQSAMAEKFINQVNDLLNQQMEETLRLVKEGNHKITRLAETLIKQSQVVGAEIDAIFKEA